jgi:hypothetical protein
MYTRLLTRTCSFLLFPFIFIYFLNKFNFGVNFEEKLWLTWTTGRRFQ